ncbi:MAG: hypothetical protein V1794_08830, partial [Candidatus Glassbacteria bacterium]
LALGWVAVYFFFAVQVSERAGLLVLAGMLAVLIILEYVRLQLKVEIPLLRHLYNFRRGREADSPGAELFFLLGVLVSLAVFDTEIAVAAILMAVFGDLTAALVGMRWGRWKPSVFGGKKSVEGSLAALGVNLGVGYLFLRAADHGPLWWQAAISSWAGIESAFGHTLWPLVLVMAVSASAVELAISKIDDNLTIPVIAGLAGQLTLMVLCLK